MLILLSEGLSPICLKTSLNLLTGSRFFQDVDVSFHTFQKEMIVEKWNIEEDRFCQING